MNNNDEVQVSVCIVTYNQQEYIVECLDSLVSQETDFKFEIIVGEDCSTDNTRAVLRQYVDQHPDLIVPIFHQNNVGPSENARQVYEKARGKYIAHVDGDDMALSGKLQQQFDVLEANPQAMICSHNVEGILDDTISSEHHWHYPAGEYTFADLLKKLPFFAHSSKMFRVNNDAGWNKLMSSEMVLDIELHLYQASIGTIIHLEEYLGRYRVDVGISAMKGNKLNHGMIQKVESIYETLLISYPDKTEAIKESYASYLLGTASSFAVIESNSNKMREYAIRSINQKFFSIKQLIMILLILFPSIGISILKRRHESRTTSSRNVT